jgi:uncharacterized damage-inducible protein DinB
MDTASQITEALRREFHRRVVEESVPRIKKCLSLLSEEEVWFRPNENLNSVGNLILHLCGNARQWVLSGIGGQPDQRERDVEFEQEGGYSKIELSLMLDELAYALSNVLNHLDAETLLEVRHVQAFQENVLAMLVHVIEHFSYHTGQIAFLTKSLKNVDTAFYGNIDLNRKGEGK